MDGAGTSSSTGQVESGNLPWDAAALGDLEFADQLLSFADEPNLVAAMPPPQAQRQAAQAQPAQQAQLQAREAGKTPVGATGKRPFDSVDGPGDERDEEFANSKACREKARRNRLNDRFSELAKLLEEPDQGPKADKASILISAISTVRNLRREIGQLRQLNKYLEERVGQQEKERGMQMYQQVVAYGQLPPGAVPIQQGQASSSQPIHVAVQPRMEQQQGYPHNMQQPMYHMVQPGPSGAPGGQPLMQHGVLQPGGHQVMPAFVQGHPEQKHPMMAPQMGVHYPSYLPTSSMDSQKDALLRPPVA